MTDETRREAICLLDNSMGQIMADTKCTYLCGWPLGRRRQEWEQCHEAMLVDTWARALGQLCTEAA